MISEQVMKIQMVWDDVSKKGIYIARAGITTDIVRIPIGDYDHKRFFIPLARAATYRCGRDSVRGTGEPRDNFQQLAVRMGMYVQTDDTSALNEHLTPLVTDNRTGEVTLIGNRAIMGALDILENGELVGVEKKHSLAESSLNAAMVGCMGELWT